MNIRKHWRKAVISIAAAFWAGCGDDSATSTQVEVVDDGNTSSEAVLGSSAAVPTSSEVVPGSSEVAPASSEAILASSSSEATSSSEAIQSSSSNDLIRRASDTTITCETRTTTETFYLSSNNNTGNSCENLKNSLENDVLSVEEIIEKEDDLANCGGYKFEPVYGVSTPDIGTRTIATYNCSDGHNWSQGDVKIKDNLLYSVKEYLEAFPPSSSSVESSSSKIIENQGCNKTDFISKDAAIDSLVQENHNMLDSAINAIGATGKLKSCIENAIQWTENLSGDRSGYIAKTQKCPDGTTSENERFTQLDKNVKQIFKERINNCTDEYSNLE